MATIAALYPTLVDVVKRTDPNGQLSRTAELLSKVNPIIQDVPMVEGNLPTGHRLTGRNLLPALGWRRYNGGIAPSKSGTEQYDETCGMLNGFSIVDCDLAKLNGNAAAFRADEDNAFLASANIEIATGIFYHNTATVAEKFLGLSPRFNATSGNPAAAQIIKADASASGADQTSVWLVGWSPQTVFGIYPKGQAGGLATEDQGKQRIVDASGNVYMAWQTEIKWNFGVAVRDHRYVVRLCNVDTSAWKADLSAGADLVDGLIQMRAALWETDTVNPVYYMNRSAFSMLNRQLAKKATTNFLEWIGEGKGRIAVFLGIPIRIVDAITSTESVVS
jgi:hypothetical protein